MAKKRFRIKDSKGNVVPYDVAAEDVTMADGRSVEAGKASLKAVAGFLDPAHFPIVMLYNVAPFTSTPDYSSIPVGIVYLDESLTAPYKRLYYKKSVEGTAQSIDLGAPKDGVIYFHQSTGKLYRWVATSQGNDGSFTQIGILGINDIPGLADAIAAAGTGAVTVTTNQDGTFVIHVGETDYTINLNHTHEGMVKLEKYTEATMPQTKDDDIIYVQVDDVTTPQAIEALYIFGLEFTGGGAATGTPAIYTTPGGSTLNLGQNDGTGASGTITVKGRNLTGDLTVAVAANSGLSLTYGSQTGSSVTIDQADAETAAGAVVTVSYSGSGALDLTDGLNISGGGASTKYMKVVVAEPAPIELDGVKFTGTQWIGTDYYPNPKTEFALELTFEPNSNTEVVNNNIAKIILGCKANSSPTSYFVFYNINTSSANDHRAYIIQILNEGDVSNQNLFAANSVGGTYPSAASMQKMTTPHSILRYTVGSSAYHLAFEPGGVPDSNNSDYTSTNLQKKTSTMTYPLGIGERPGHTDSPYARFNLTVHRLTITEDGVAVRDYVPRIKGGKVGLLDIATNGTGLFLTSETAKTSGLDADELVAVPLSSNS